ncbi:MAG TPA: DnaA/Hda family protein, partial [Bryobacteraceae bacterium]|nr:DnaA/Hda family protein [Bryobacteraceae bacterium]
MSDGQQTPWNLIQERLAKSVSPESYRNWILRTQYAGLEDRVLTVRVPDEGTLSFIEEEYGAQIQELAHALALGIDRVVFTVDGVRPANVADRTASLSDLESPVTLNPRFTFESFVVGASNQFAHAAAQAVAIDPSRRYNPLYLYGGVG